MRRGRAMWRRVLSGLPLFPADHPGADDRQGGGRANKRDDKKGQGMKSKGGGENKKKGK